MSGSGITPEGWWELVRAVIAAVLGWLAGWKFPPGGRNKEL